LDVLPAAQYLQLARLLPAARFEDVSPAIRQVRQRKSAWEIERMRAGAPLSEAMYAAVPRALRAGVAEVELAAAVEGEARRLGHQGMIRSRGFNQQSYFGGIVAGESGLVPSSADSSLGGTGVSPAQPLSAGWHRIQRGEPVMVDYVFVADGYHLDRTRLYSLGPPSAAVAAAYAAMVTIQNELAALARPGLPAGALYDHAVRRVAELGHAEGFLGYGEAQVRFVGHGVGLELDEWPVLAPGVATPLEPGMTIAIEPKVAVPGLGMIGLEHTWLVTDTGLERLTLGTDEIVVV